MYCGTARSNGGGLADGKVPTRVREYGCSRVDAIPASRPQAVKDDVDGTRAGLEARRRPYQGGKPYHEEPTPTKDSADP